MPRSVQLYLLVTRNGLSVEAKLKFDFVDDRDSFARKTTGWLISRLPLFSSPYSKLRTQELLFHRPTIRAGPDAENSLSLRWHSSPAIPELGRHDNSIFRQSVDLSVAQGRSCTGSSSSSFLAVCCGAVLLVCSRQTAKVHAGSYTDDPAFTLSSAPPMTSSTVKHER